MTQARLIYWSHKFRASLVVAALLSFASAASVFAQDGTTPAGINAALTLVLTAAISVERALEILWNYVEWFLVGVRKWDGESLKRMEYLQLKSGSSLLIGVILGIAVANFSGMHLLLNAGIGNITDSWDIMITGILIGAGAKPAHDILGILSQFKNYLGNTAIMRREEAGKALAEGVLRLAQSEAQAMVDVPGVGPTRLAAPGRTADLGGGAEASDAEQAQIQRYADILHKAVLR